MAWPMKVARNAPAMLGVVVRMKPLGLFGPGASQRAMRPATKPTTMIHNRPPMLMSVLPFLNASIRFRLNSARDLVLGRQPSVRRQMVDHLRQILAEAGEQFVARQPALGGQAFDLVGAERIGEIAGRDRLVLALADPGIRGLAVAALLELVQEIATPAAQHAPGRPAREQAAEAALEQPSKTANTAAVRSVHRRRSRRR